jgi:carbon monoxide dehydrogenase subunit G
VHIEGERRFDASPREVYRALTDPDALGEAFSVIERVDADGNNWMLHVRLPFPGGLKLKVSVHVEELRDAEHARLRAWGKNLGGRISIDSSFDLQPSDAGTLMRWSAEVEGAGILRGLGSQALAPVARQHAERALDRLIRSQVTST